VSANGAASGAAGDHRGLHEDDVAKLDLIHDRGNIRLSDGVQRHLVPPVSQEGVSFHEPQQRPDACLLQRGSKDHDGVQTCPDALVENLRGCADLLTLISPARRRVLIPNVASGHRLVQRLHDLVDAFWS